MIILGIDPGFGRLGCAVLKKSDKAEELVYSTCLNSKRKLTYEERIFCLGQELKKIIKKYKPDVAAMEKIFFTKNQKTALQVAEVRGMILYLATSHNIPVQQFTPLEIKIAITGYGRAEKIQVQKMVEKILKIKKMPKSDDEIDAIAIAITCSSVQRKKISTGIFNPLDKTFLS
jgi:crossover junction endodeoxyribonuclease RuvC